MAKFNENINFLKFLNLVKNDAGLRSQLKAGNKNSIDSFVGLDNDEKNYLKNIDWNEVKLLVDVDSPDDFKMTLSFASKEVCETRAAIGAVESRCYKS